MRARVLAGDERGLTLIELIIALAITSAVVVGAGMAYAEMMSVTTKSVNHLAAVRELQNAGDWMSRDGQQSQPAYTLVGDDLVTPEQEALTLGWDLTVFGGDKTRIIYVLLEDHSLRRDFYLNDNPTPTSQFTVAEDVTGIDIPAGGSYFEMALTVTKGTYQQASETRTYYFVRRSDA